MPTGYTADIPDGITFEQFVWRCARAFGALVLLRDAPDAPIPERFEPSDWNVKQLEGARARKLKLESMSPDELAAAAAAAHQHELESLTARRQRTDKQAYAYGQMLGRVLAWKPPSADHFGLRDFMAEQIQSSISFDCGETSRPVQLAPDVWLRKQLDDLSWSIAYHEREHAEEIARTEERNEWLRLLRESVPPPERP